jgi:photosystem II CP47 chlorophyll apoprotein
LGADGFDPYNPGGVPAHHIAAGILGFSWSFHLCVRPSIRLYFGLSMVVLNQYYQAVLLAVFYACRSSWYSVVRFSCNPIELFGPTRYQWDQGFSNKKFKTSSN